MRLVKQKSASEYRCCGPQGCGRLNNQGSERMCIGAQCMAWHNDKDIADPEIYGYCGLAGHRHIMTSSADQA